MRVVSKLLATALLGAFLAGDARAADKPVDRPRTAPKPRPKETSVEAAAKKPVKDRVYTFGALDVEGKLKTPQLLYFLNRVKLELDTSAVDKRSFMKELEDSAGASGL